MEFAEYLRVRRALAWHIGILLAITLFFVALGQQTIKFDGPDGSTTVTPGAAFPLGPLTIIATIFAAIFASSAGGSLNRAFSVHDIAWTKPVPRMVLALRYVLIDVAAVLLVFALTLLAVLVVLFRMRIVPIAEPTFGPQLVLAAGISVMWYALVQLTTFWFPPRALMLAGILWPIALVGDALRDALRGLAGGIVGVIDVFNPLAYLSPKATDLTFWHGSFELRALVVWLLAALFCTVAIVLWPRREA